MTSVSNGPQPRGSKLTSSFSASFDLNQVLKELLASQDEARPSSTAPSSNKEAAKKPSAPRDDLYLTSGKFEWSEKTSTRTYSYQIQWKRSRPVPMVVYPPRTVPVSIVNLSFWGKTLFGEKTHLWKPLASWMDSRGYVYARFLKPSGKIIVFKSPNRQFTSNYRTLAVAMSMLKSEAAHIRRHGLNSLPSAVRNKKGEVVTTRGALVLAALIKKMGAKSIARAKIDKTSALAIRTFDNIQRLLRMKGMEAIVHRAVELGG